MHTYPDPDDTNPTTLNGLDVGEAPVTVGSDDRRDELSKAERAEQCDRGALHEEPTVRTGDEDEGLRDDGDLEVYDGVQLVVVVVVGSRRLSVRESDAELAVEPIGPNADSNKGNPRNTSDNRRQ